MKLAITLISGFAVCTAVAIAGPAQGKLVDPAMAQLGTEALSSISSANDMQDAGKSGSSYLCLSNSIKSTYLTGFESSSEYYDLQDARRFPGNSYSCQ
jgi:hypothetical protein